MTLPEAGASTRSNPRTEPRHMQQAAGDNPEAFWAASGQSQGTEERGSSDILLRGEMKYQTEPRPNHNTTSATKTNLAAPPEPARAADPHRRSSQGAGGGLSDIVALAAPEAAGCGSRQCRRGRPRSSALLDPATRARRSGRTRPTSSALSSEARREPHRRSSNA